MRVILAGLGAANGLVAKDTVAGGYGSRLVPFSLVTRVYTYFKRRRLGLPSIQMGYLASIFGRQGHDVVFTRAGTPAGDLALVLSSLVDYRRETAWADDARRRSRRTGPTSFTSTACGFRTATGWSAPASAADWISRHYTWTSARACLCLGNPG